MLAGIMPILQRPGEMMPGQFGPISREFLVFRYSHAFTMSSAGMPSVMHTINAMPASAASIMASAAPGGGTKITVALAPVLATASLTVLKMGQPSCVVPPLPGVTPPTTCVPYACEALAWNVPSRPVSPCTTSRVDLSTRMLTCPLCRRDTFRGRVFHGLCHDEIQSARFQYLAALFDVGAFQSQHGRQLDVGLLRRAHHAVGQRIHAQDAAENIDQ